MSGQFGLETRVRVAQSVYARPFGDEIVLLEFGRGEYYALDAIGAQIWKRLEAGLALGVVATDIAADYDVSAERALTDVVALVTDMEARALLVRRDE